MEVICKGNYFYLLPTQTCILVSLVFLYLCESLFTNVNLIIETNDPRYIWSTAADTQCIAGNYSHMLHSVTGIYSVPETWKHWLKTIKFFIIFCDMTLTNYTCCTAVSLIRDILSFHYIQTHCRADWLCDVNVSEIHSVSVRVPVQPFAFVLTIFPGRQS